MEEKKYEKKPGECSLFLKSHPQYGDSYSGLIEVDGKEYWLNLFHAKQNNPKSPAFNVKLKPKTPAVSGAPF